jgi:hypothetical protein
MTVLKKVKKSDRETLFAALNGELGGTVEETLKVLPKHLHEPFAAGRELADVLYEAGVESGAMKRWATEADVAQGLAKDVDVPLLAPKREFYVPLTVKHEGAKAAERAAAGIRHGGQAQLASGSARARKSMGQGFVRDPVTQFEAHVGQYGPKVGASTEAKMLGKYLKAPQAQERILPGSIEARDVNKLFPKWKDVPISKADKAYILSHNKGMIFEMPAKLQRVRGAAVPAQSKVREALRRSLEKVTGLEHVHLRSDLRDALKLVTAKSSKLKKGSYDIVMPTHVARRIKELAPLFRGSPVQMNRAYQTAIKVNENVIRPYMQVWRTGKTVLGGPMYFVRNTAGALGLAALAHGMGVFSPKLQRGAVLASLASGNMGKEAIRAKKFVLRSGEETTIGKVLDLAGKAGIIDQFEMRAGLDMMAKGIAAAPARVGSKLTEVVSPVYLPLGKKLSARNVGRMSENYQHLVVFMGALESTTDPKALAKALDFTSKFAGNYGRLSPFEKNVLREVFGFYSWSRFIFPHIMTQLVENPQRLAPFAKTREFLRREFEREKPISWNLVPEYQRDLAVPAPGRWQPKADHDFAVMTVEDPLQMGLSFIPVVQSLFGGRGAFGTDVYNSIGPAVKIMSMIATGLDPETGEPMERMVDPVRLMNDVLEGQTDVAKARFNSSAVGKMLTDPVSRPSRNIANLWRLYEDAGMPEEVIEMKLKYRVGRDWWILGQLLNVLSGKELTKGSAVPSTSTYYYEGIQEAGRQKGKAAKSLPITRSRLQRSK